MLMGDLPTEFSVFLLQKMSSELEEWKLRFIKNINNALLFKGGFKA